MDKLYWEDSSVFKINKEDGHAIAMPYDDLESALSGEESRYKQSLNGMWKFYWQRGIKNQPEGFESVLADRGIFCAVLLCQHFSEGNQQKQTQNSAY